MDNTPFGNTLDFVNEVSDMDVFQEILNNQSSFDLNMQ